MSTVLSMTEPTAVDGDYYRRMLRGARWWVAWGAVFGIVLAVLYPMVTSPSYAATVTVRLTSSSGSTPVDVVSEAAAAEDPAVLDAARTRLGTRLTRDQLGEHVAATGVDASALVKITATDTSSAGAIDIARAVSRSFLAYRAETAVASRTRALDVIARQIADLQQQAGSGSANEIIALRQERASLLLVDPSPGDVVADANADNVSAPASPILLALVGLFVGALLGLLAGVVANLLSRRVRDRRDVGALWPDVPAVEVERNDARSAQLATRELRVVTLPQSARPGGTEKPPLRGAVVNLASPRSAWIAMEMGRAMVATHEHGSIIVLGEATGDEVAPVRGSRKKSAPPAMNAADDTPGLRVVNVPTGGREGTSAVLVTDEVRSLVPGSRSGTATAVVLPYQATHADVAEALDLVDAVFVLVGPETRKESLRAVIELTERVGVPRVGVLVAPEASRRP